MKQENCEEKIRGLFFNYYNRPNLTPLHTSRIQRKLENRYPPWKVNDVLKKMEGKQILRSMEVKTKNVGKILFYFPTKIIINYDEEEKMMAKIKRITNYIDRYSHPRITEVLGRHLHALVKNELRVQGFTIIDEGRVNSHNGIEWVETKHNIDLLAKHEEKQLTVGVEVKNELDIIDRAEVRIKLKLCKKLQIIPIFACRWLEPYRQEIIDNGGFLWQFKTQMFPIGFESFVKEMQQKFGFPVKVSTEIPEKSVKEFENWIKTR